jgi:uncharacterized protein YxeA
MNTNHTDITIVLDRSGSMQIVKKDTIGGFNTFLKEQQKAPGTASITLHQFDDVYETVLNGVDIKRAAPLNETTYVPRGWTALLDAIGNSILSTGERLGRIPEADRAGKVVFVIITDGEENKSHSFTLDRIQTMITHQREKYAWEFVFLGANQDAIQAGTRMGMLAGQTMTYASNSMGTKGAFAAVACNVASYRSTGQTADLNFTASQREEQEEAGA